MAERKLYSVIFTVLIFGLTVVAAASPTLAGKANNQNAAKDYFPGLWEGIDPLDGSTAQLSLSNHKDGEFDFIFRESFFTVCLSNKNKLGRGVVIGKAMIVEQNLLMMIDAVRTCFDDDNKGDATTSGLSAKFPAFPTDDIVVLEPPVEDFPPIVLHRLSR